MADTVAQKVSKFLASFPVGTTPCHGSLPKLRFYNFPGYRSCHLPRGVQVLVDGAHALGMLPISMK